MEKTEFVSTSGIEISIGLAVYNEQNNIEKALRSILSQTHKDFELIIRMIAQKIILLKYALNQDSRIKIFKHKILVLLKILTLFLKNQNISFLYG